MEECKIKPGANSQKRGNDATFELGGSEQHLKKTSARERVCAGTKAPVKEQASE